MPEISVIMGLHNGRAHLPAAVHSLLAQTFADWELVAVDNGSTDDSAGLVASLVPADRLRLLREPAPLGPGGALVRAVGAATGRYLAVLDQDDVARPDRFAWQLAFLHSRPDVGLVAGRSVCIDDAGRTLGLEPCPASHEELAPMTAYVHTLRHSTVTFRREVARAVPYRGEFEGAADYDFFTRAAELTRLACLPDVLVDYRLHARSVTQSRAALVTACGGLVRMLTRRRRLGRDEGLADWAPRFKGLAEVPGVTEAAVHAGCARLFWQAGHDDLAALHAWQSWRGRRSGAAVRWYLAATLRGLARRQSSGVRGATLRAWLKEPAHQLLVAGGMPDRPQF